MNSVRMTTSPQQATERPNGATVARRSEPRQVVGVEAAEADRRRSLREELQADAERFPESLPEAPEGTARAEEPGVPPADPHAVAEAVAHLGSAADKILQPIGEQQIRHILSGHVDEQA